ncbi:MAG: hypothetical protein CYPHOPRED_003694, partial [Cyphobasidiales sp. Tagirdzhanova-0007]
EALIAKISSLADFPNVSEEQRIIRGLRWIGLFSSEPVTARGNLIDTLCSRLEQRMQYEKGERDMVMLQHKFEIENKDGSTVLDVQAAFLSNYEVLALLKDDIKAQENDLKRFQQSVPRKLRTQTHTAVKGMPYLDYDQALRKLVPDNLRTMQVEVGWHIIEKDGKNPTNIKRTLAAIDNVPALLDSEYTRGSNALTRIERLMMVNLAPMKLVDLAVIVEELENRYSEETQAQFLTIFDRELGASAEMQAGAQAEADETMEKVQEEQSKVHQFEDEQEDHVSQANQQVYADEDEYDESRIMPDEENDLVDEGIGDGGRDAEIREIDEVGDGE